MGVDVVAAGSGVGSVVVAGEGDAWRPEALGAPSKVDSLVGSCPLKPVRTPVAIFGSLGVCIYVPASRHWLISYSPIHLT